VGETEMLKLRERERERDLIPERDANRVGEKPWRKSGRKR